MKTMMITPDLLRKWDACKDGYKWALPIIGDGIELSAFLPEFDRDGWFRVTRDEVTMRRIPIARGTRGGYLHNLWVLRRDAVAAARRLIEMQARSDILRRVRA